MTVPNSQPRPSQVNHASRESSNSPGTIQTTARRQTLDKKPLRFVIVGAVNTVLDFSLMNIFRLAGLDIIIANTMSTGIAMVASFFLNKKWTFRNAGQNYTKQVVLFFVFTMIGIWIIQNGCIWLITTYVPHFGLTDQLFANLAKVIASIPSLMWNYITYAKIVFAKTNTDQSAESVKT